MKKIGALFLLLIIGALGTNRAVATNHTFTTYLNLANGSYSTNGNSESFLEGFSSAPEIAFSPGDTLTATFIFTNGQNFVVTNSTGTNSQYMGVSFYQISPTNSLSFSYSMQLAVISGQLVGPNPYNSGTSTEHPSPYLFPAIFEVTTSSVTFGGVVLNMTYQSPYTAELSPEVFQLTTGVGDISIATNTLPLFLGQPASQYVFHGANVSFSVVASGPPPLGYAWYVNGSAIPGANASSFTTNNVQAAMSGSQFYCVATSASGSVTSSVAVLQVASSNLVVLHSFSSYPDAEDAFAGLILSGNVLFGSGAYGGADDGALIQITTNVSAYSKLYTFTALSSSQTNTDGAHPEGTLTLGNGTLYGTTVNGGTAGDGTLFSVSTNGQNFTNLLNFNGANGYNCQCTLALSGNTLFGTTENGGAAGNGTIFSINTNGTGFTTLHSFTALTSATNSDGALPTGALLLCGNVLYGAAATGGPHGSGTIFRINTDSTGFTNIYSFSSAQLGTNSEGNDPQIGLILSGTIYGAARSGGPLGGGTIFCVSTNGAGFANLHSFINPYTNGFVPNVGGGGPYGSLILSGNTLYGVAEEGGMGGEGTLFQINTDGSGFTSLYSFTGGNDGRNPNAPLALSGNTLYGSTLGGGGVNAGVVFSFVLPPSPLQILNDSNFGIQSGAFGFDFVGPANETVVIEATTNLVTGPWVPLQTNTLGNASIYFNDPARMNFPGRFYRAQVQ